MMVVYLGVPFPAHDGHVDLVAETIWSVHLKNSKEFSQPEP